MQSSYLLTNDRSLEELNADYCKKYRLCKYSLLKIQAEVQHKK